ncbi:MAG: primosomal protein N' [Lachnospiraceae bacterium]|nr:primosomal protein N' [Ruminococcus sp.]MCM1273893.1 primosomal protein N' [Lachnospiraceae bacterium]
MTAQIAVENTLYAFDTLFSYEIPRELESSVTRGVRVVVPFGRGNRKRIGVVFSVSSEPPEGKIKPIDFVIDGEPVLSGELMDLCEWIRENTFCTYYDAFRSILPPGLGFSLKSGYRLAEGFSGELSDKERGLLNLLKTADKAAFSALISGSAAVVRSLAAKGALVEENAVKRRVGDESITMLRLCPDVELPKPTAKQRAVIAFLEAVETASLHEVCYECAVTPAVVKRLVEKNVLERYENIVFRTESGTEASQSPDSIVFSPKQQEIFDGLLGLMSRGEPKCALLRGVTGSGKTSVFIRLINEALKRGQSAIMLVPEISLTPQMVNKFKSLFGDEVAVMHSSLSVGERADEYRRIREGRARIVIGTRSAVFAPVKNLGIIVIDEEGESSYKSESTPRYHARDVAKQRCFAHNSLLLLASATPSLESCCLAKTGRYSLFEIDERYNNAALPEVYIINMQEERRNGNMSTFSMPLIGELESNLGRGEQSILLLNRRGYHTSVRCLACGKPLECPNCSLPMTYHKANGCVICHYCGYMRRLDAVCPKCGGRFFDMKGEGTQLIEDELAQMFPKARILRMDADTTSTKNAFERKFKAFADGEYDIMVGTQMIAKGLDFPNVTLVGVLKTDNSLYAADFRAYERTFSLITQVVGRAGRSGKKGRALLQTFSPEHYVINLAAHQNYPDFYAEEISLREAQFYPPFCDLVTFGFSSLDNGKCSAAAKKFSAMLTENAKPYGGRVPMRILGPAPNTVGKINGRYRYRLIIKCKNSKSLRSVIETTLKQAYADKAFENVGFYADINGNTD